MADLSGLQRRLHPLLHVPGRLYAGLMRLRRQWYESGALLSHNPEKPCVSVGNICWGGTGKTPLTQWLMQWALNRGLTPAVLTRGYRAAPPELPFLVSEDSTPAQAGDEPLLLARSCPEALVAVDPNRTRAAKWLFAKHHPDLYIMDDGFQHLGIRRSLDLVLLRPQDLTDDWDRVIPAGPWREGEEALSRASAFLIKAPHDEFQALTPLIKEYLNRFRTPVFPFTFAPRKLMRLDRVSHARGFGDEPYLLVSGVGEPEQVSATAEALLGRPPELHMRFDDHYAYKQQDWDFIASEAARVNASHVLTTGKDAVKLIQLETHDLWTFDHTLDFGQGVFTRQTFPEWWEDSWPML
ncbi:tetraacyldisaccharide 4'-kinase [Desulfocurvus sp. DL9XJH121]